MKEEGPDISVAEIQEILNSNKSITHRYSDGRISYDFHRKRLHIHSLNIVNEVLIEFGDKLKYLHISNCSFSDNLIISGQHDIKEFLKTRDAISIVNTKIRLELTIRNVNIKKLNIRKVSVSNGDISLNMLEASVLALSRCVFEDLLIDECGFNSVRLIRNKGDSIYTSEKVNVKMSFASLKDEFNYIEFNDLTANNIRLSGTKLERVIFEDVKAENVFLNDCEIRDQLLPYNSKFHMLSITGKLISEEILEFGNDSDDSTSIELNTLSISMSQGKIKFGNLDLELLKIAGENDSANIIIREVEVRNVDINGFVNNGTLQLIKLSSKSELSWFEILDSELGKTKFSRINWDDFKIIEFNTSDFSQISYSEINWFKEFTSDSTQGRQEIFRQLKNIAAVQGDKIQALSFRANEMRAFRIYSNPTAKPSDIVALWFARINDYGMNWARPFGLLIVSSFFFFGLCQLTAGVLDGFYFKGVFPFFNPTHRINELGFPATADFNGWFQFFNMSGRVVNGILIYQIIAAFRKYNSK